MTKKEEVKTIAIKPPNYGYVLLDISNKDQSSMIVHKFSEKSKKQLEAMDQNKKGKKGTPRPVRNPKQEYLDSLYTMPGKKNEYGVPVSGFKKAMVRAAKMAGVTMTDMKMGMWILEDDGGLVKITGKPNMREDIVRLSGASRAPQIRYRGEFKKWTAKLKIRYDAEQYAPEDIINLCARAGFSVGWGERRLEKGYDHGGWVIEKAKVVS
jgi:hypothetical protein